MKNKLKGYENLVNGEFERLRQLDNGKGVFCILHNYWYRGEDAEPRGIGLWPYNGAMGRDAEQLLLHHDFPYETEFPEYYSSKREYNPEEMMREHWITPRPTTDLCAWINNRVSFEDQKPQVSIPANLLRRFISLAVDTNDNQALTHSTETKKGNPEVEAVVHNLQSRFNVVIDPMWPEESA